MEQISPEALLWNPGHPASCGKIRETIILGKADNLYCFLHSILLYLELFKNQIIFR